MLKALAQATVMQRIHGSGPGLSVAGSFGVRRGRRTAARLVAWALRLPSEGHDVPVTLVVERHRWTRRFGDRRIVTVWEADASAERIGPLRIYYDVRGGEGTQTFTSRTAVFCLGRVEIPVPRGLAPVILAEERDLDDAMHVAVTVRTPWLGMLLAYEGVVR